MRAFNNQLEGRPVAMSELEAEVAKYLDLNGKYLREADELMRKEDYPQASEKLWGAAAEMIKAVAATRGLALGTHRSISDFVTRLHTEHPEWRLADKFAHANNLHINFYEDWLSPELVEEGRTAVKDLVAHLKKLIQ